MNKKGKGVFAPSYIPEWKKKEEKAVKKFQKKEKESKERDKKLKEQGIDPDMGGSWTSTDEFGNS